SARAATPSSLTLRALTSFHTFQPLAGAGEDLVVVERQGRERLQIVPAHLGRVVGGFGLDLPGIDLRQVGDGDGTPARVAARVAEGVQLFQAIRLDAGP